MSKNTNERLKDLTDEELMSLYQIGDYAAFETLYGRHSSKVFQYLKQKVVVDIAQDLLQEAFMKVHKARHQYSIQYPFLPWLFTISRNTLFDYFKSNAKNSIVLPIISEGLVAEPEPAGPELNLTFALKNLPENQKRAIELRYLNEWSFEKIAEDIQTTPDNVRQLISRGLKKVRNGFKKGAP